MTAPSARDELLAFAGPRAQDGRGAMTFDAHRVRVELCDVMRFGRETGDLTGSQGAGIWPGDGDGKITRRRKPDALLVGDTRAEVLRNLADWIEANDDPGLTVLVAVIKAKRGEAS